MPACVVLVSQPAKAHDFTLNVTSGTDVPINDSANWDTIRSIGFAASAHAHNCMAVASADIANPGGAVANQSYIFTVRIDNSNPVTGGSAERTLELVNNPGVDDPAQHPVSVNNVFFAAALGSHTFYFLGRKVGAAINTEAFDGTLSVVCIAL
ncbi:MAG: hypothetical protein ACT4O2_11005 [Beijerinckiaceae bacterium]